jgi:hypothetical protein
VENASAAYLALGALVSFSCGRRKKSNGLQGKGSSWIEERVDGVHGLRPVSTGGPWVEVNLLVLRRRRRREGRGVVAQAWLWRRRQGDGGCGGRGARAGRKVSVLSEVRIALLIGEIAAQGIVFPASKGAMEACCLHPGGSRESIIGRDIRSPQQRLR